MPFRHQMPALCIWLESDIYSRKIKSIVSHRGRSNISEKTYEEKIREKDLSNIGLYKNIFNIDIGPDPAFFDLIVDISTYITEPTLTASLFSIKKAHQLIRSAVGYYLTKSIEFKNSFLNECEVNKLFIIQNNIC
jgi:cytidylate kinase